MSRPDTLMSAKVRSMYTRVLDALQTFERRSHSRSFVKIGAPLPDFLGSAAPTRTPATKERALFLALSL